MWPSSHGSATFRALRRRPTSPSPTPAPAGAARHIVAGTMRTMNDAAFHPSDGSRMERSTSSDGENAGRPGAYGRSAVGRVEVANSGSRAGPVAGVCTVLVTPPISMAGHDACLRIGPVTVPTRMLQGSSGCRLPMTSRLAWAESPKSAARGIDSALVVFDQRAVVYTTTNRLGPAQHVARPRLGAHLWGYGYTPRFVRGDDPVEVHQQLAATLDQVLDDSRPDPRRCQRRGSRQRTGRP